MGFAFTELLGFKLLPRLKNIGAIQLYAPGASQAAWPRLEKILKKRPILVRGTYSKRALFPELVTSLDDDPAAGPCGEALAGLDEQPGTDCEC